MTQGISPIAAFTEDQAAALTGVSKRQLRHWASTDFFKPSLSLDDDGLAGLRLYSFRDLVCLKVINALRNEAKIPFSELRETKLRLAHLGDGLWAKTVLYVLGKRVVFDNPDTGEKEEAVSGQGVLQIPLRVVSGKMEDAVSALRCRKPSAIGKIERKRSVAQNQPVIAGTRITVRSIQAFAKAGYSAKEINEQYPDITLSDIEAAIHYEDAA